MSRSLRLLIALALFAPLALSAQGRGGGANWADSLKFKYSASPQLEKLKAEASAEIDKQAKLIQVMV
ncbi:MAG: hypothetical protein P3A28_05980, partial [Gemmatimonadota bacterium]|nr:hypothetical protein [Gemmatimonadota bacterium]